MMNLVGQAEFLQQACQSSSYWTPSQDLQANIAFDETDTGPQPTLS